MYNSYRSQFLPIAVFLVLVSSVTLGAGVALAQAMPAMQGMHASRHASAQVADVVRDPADVPPPAGNRPPTTVKVELTTVELTGELDPATGTTYRYWTFNGKVPGPMIRVRQGDMVEVTLHNNPSSHMVHSIDLHAALGPGGGAALSQVTPGQEKTFTFQATTPGLFVYHCGTPMIADHIANGMYGLILVEPAGGLPHVDREYYVMQGEIYTAAAKGKPGAQSFSEAKLMQESPEYFVFNGAVDALTRKYPLHANTGESVRIFFGDAGPNETSSLHVVGEIFTHDYQLGSLTSPALNGVQTASIPPGGAAILEIKAALPGQFNFMDHAMARMAKGLIGVIDVQGRENAILMHPGSASDATQKAAAADLKELPGGGALPIMHAGAAGASSTAKPAEAITPADQAETTAALEIHSQRPAPDAATIPVENAASRVAQRASKITELDGCATLIGPEVRLRELQSGKIYRLQGVVPLAENLNSIVHVTGKPGRVAAVAAAIIPTFTVSTVDQLAPNCHAKVSREKLLAVRGENAAPPAGAVVIGMSDMSFAQSRVTITAGPTVVWKNTSSTVHNVVDDAAQAVSAADVQVPADAKPFGSGYLQPGQTYSRTFTVPGTYRYVCTLHETAGMKGIVVVKAAPATDLASNEVSTRP